MKLSVLIYNTIASVSLQENRGIISPLIIKKYANILTSNTNEDIELDVDYRVLVDNAFLFVNEAAWQSVSTIYWISEFLFLAIFCLYIAIDMNRLKKYAENSLTIETNLALFFAMNLYTDFINLFVRLLYIFALARNNN